MNKFNSLAIKSHVRLSMFVSNIKDKINLDKRGISTLVEVAGVLAIIVACIILIMPTASASIKGIWTSVTKNANSFFTKTTKG